MPAPESSFLRCTAPAVRRMGTSARQRGSQQGHKTPGRITGFLVLGVTLYQPCNNVVLGLSRQARRVGVRYGANRKGDPVFGVKCRQGLYAPQLIQKAEILARLPDIRHWVKREIPNFCIL
jgi:hypothetical protein